MDIRKVSEGFAVGPQPQPADLAELAAQGFVAVIANRPDGEEEGQPGVAELRAAAEEAGLAFHHLPTRPGHYPPPLIAAFAAVRRGTSGPVFAFCRTGTRAIMLDALANPEGLTVAERIARVEAAGYDPASLRALLGEG